MFDFEAMMKRKKEREEKIAKLEDKKEYYYKWYSKIFKKYGYDKRNQELHDILVGFCGPYFNGINKKGLFLCAKEGEVNTGVGKTYGMSIIAKIFAIRLETVVRLCKAMDASEERYLDMLNSANYYDSEKMHDKIIDEVGAESITNNYGSKYELFIEVLESRYDKFIQKGIFTHFTSNLTKKQLESRYGHRVWSRINEMCTVIEVSGNDRRFE